MIDKLKQIENQLLLDLLQKPDQWKTLLVDYHPPIVERCWVQIGNYRIFIHFIHRCETKDALFHPHPWPSAMHVLTGQYEMGLGFGPGLEEPEKMCTILVENGGMYYDMQHIDGWHYVRPVNGVCATVMLIGKPWDREEIKSDEPLKPMDNGRKLLMLEWFTNYYRNRIHGDKLAENSVISRGNWVILDEKVMSKQDQAGMEKYFGQKGFVIKKEGSFIDVRFGNDRTRVDIKNVILLKESDRSDENVKSEAKAPPVKYTPGKHVDDMDPSLWPDDDKDI